jgi:hypothetical protein
VFALLRPRIAALPRGTGRLHDRKGAVHTHQHHQPTLGHQPLRLACRYIMVCRCLLQELNESWERERDEMKHLQNIKAEMDRVNLEIQNAERDYDLNHAAELKYGTLMQLQKQLSEAEAALEAQVRLCAFASVGIDMLAVPSGAMHLALRSEVLLLQGGKEQR